MIKSDRFNKVTLWMGHGSATYPFEDVDTLTWKTPSRLYVVEDTISCSMRLVALFFLFAYLVLDRQSQTLGVWCNKQYVLRRARAGGRGDDVVGFRKGCRKPPVDAINFP